MKKIYTVPNRDELIQIVNIKLQSIQQQIQQSMSNNAIKDSILLDITIGLNFIKKYSMKQTNCQNIQSKGWCKYGNDCWYKHPQELNINTNESDPLTTNTNIQNLNNNYTTFTNDINHNNFNEYLYDNNINQKFSHNNHKYDNNLNEYNYDNYDNIDDNMEDTNNFINDQQYDQNNTDHDYYSDNQYNTDTNNRFNNKNNHPCTQQVRKTTVTKWKPKPKQNEKITNTTIKTNNKKRKRKNRKKHKVLNELDKELLKTKEELKKIPELNKINMQIEENDESNELLNLMADISDEMENESDNNNDEKVESDVILSSDENCSSCEETTNDTEINYEKYLNNNHFKMFSIFYKTDKHYRLQYNNEINRIIYTNSIRKKICSECEETINIKEDWGAVQHFAKNHLEILINIHQDVISKMKENEV